VLQSIRTFYPSLVAPEKKYRKKIRKIDNNIIIIIIIENKKKSF